MTSVGSTPRALRPYESHGVDLQWRDGAQQASGECPFCSAEGKFSVNVHTGLWRCFVCNAGDDDGDRVIRGGNALEFLRLLHRLSDEHTNDYDDLMKSRGILHFETLALWGAARSIVDGTWLLPGFDAEGRLCQLYRWMGHRDEARKRWVHTLYPTPGLETSGERERHGIHGVFPLDEDPDAWVDVCEGPWDGMVMWEALGGASVTPFPNVVAVPGCTTFFDSWCSLFAGRRVRLWFDSDHPRTNKVTGQVSPPGGTEGMRRVAQKLSGYKDPPKEIQYLKWGTEGYDPTRKSGWDVRDTLTLCLGNGTVEGRREELEALSEQVVPIPVEWTNPTGISSVRLLHRGEDCLPCHDWRELVGQWRHAMKWTEGLDRFLSVGLACIISTETLGDPVWMRGLGPPGCGKSTLCEAFAAAKRYVVCKSTLRGFHSGYKTDRGGEEDHSLIAQIKGKTLVIKDGDTLMNLPNLGQIISEARDLFDGASRAHYRHGLQRDYEGIRLTWILCGTGSLRALDQSELGARFLDCVIMDEIPESLEVSVNKRALQEALTNVSIPSNGKVETTIDAKMYETQQMTGGYIIYLRKNATDLITPVTVSEEDGERIMNYGEFVSFVRARPSRKQKEVTEREMSTRLVKQHARLAKCLAAVMGKVSVDAEVMRRVRQVALDTARGETLRIIRLLRQNPAGMTTNGINNAIVHGEEVETARYLRFLRDIGVVRIHVEKLAGTVTRRAWTLTDRLTRLADEVLGER